MNAIIHVFEDGSLRDSICADIQQDIHEHLKKNHVKKWHGQFNWHSTWNVSDKFGTTIQSDAHYNNALDYCLSGSAAGIVCFDFVLQYKAPGRAISITNDQISKVFGGVLPEGITKAEFDTHPGLLLAFAMAKNTNADVDIYLCTSNGTAHLKILKAIKASASSGSVVENFGLAIPVAAKNGKLAEQLTPLVDAYINRRSAPPP